MIPVRAAFRVDGAHVCVDDNNVQTRYLRTVSIVLALGVLIQLFLCQRSWIGGDQMPLLDLGLDFLETGKLRPMAKQMSGGGLIPGSLLQLLIGLPLKVWPDYRAPIVLIGIFHLAAGLIATRVLSEAAGSRTALLFLIVYWLSPWRRYHAGLLWEPGFLFLPAAVHFWSCWKLRVRPAPLPSALLLATLALTFQLHGSFLLLVILTALLFFQRVIRVHVKAAILGGVIGALPLIPTIRALVEGTLPAVMPSEGFLGFGLVKVIPVLRGVHYWFRLGSLDIGRRLQRVIFLDGDWVSGHQERLVLQGAVALLWVLAATSVLLALAASWWYFRRAPREAPRSREWTWLRTFTLNAFIAVLLTSALSPVTIQGWHVVIALHAAALPVTFWIAERWPPRQRWMRWAILLFLLLRIPEIMVIGFGYPSYRGKAFPTSYGEGLSERQRRLVVPGRAP